MLEHANRELDVWAKRLEVDKLDDSDRLMAFSIAAQMPLDADTGMPDVKGAIALIEADRARNIQAYLKSKRPGIPTPQLDGLTGQPTFDARDQKARLQLANAVAERAVSRHA